MSPPASARVLVEQDDTLVRILSLAPGEVAPWHWHSEVMEQVLCLEGVIAVDMEHSPEGLELRGGRATVAAVGPRATHRVRNLTQAPATYLLIQHGGRYDFNAAAADLSDEAGSP